MFNFKDKFSSLMGYTMNPYEQAKIIQLENDLEELRNEKDCKNQLFKILEEQLEGFKAEYEAQVELNKAKGEQLEDNLKSCRQKAIILRKYLECFNNHELVVDKLRREVDVFNESLWRKLKPTMDKYKVVLEESKRLKEAHQRCMELQQKAHSSIAPSH